jgi:hypothetical protein
MTCSTHDILVLSRTASGTPTPPFQARHGIGTFLRRISHRVGIGSQAKPPTHSLPMPSLSTCKAHQAKRTVPPLVLVHHSTGRADDMRAISGFVPRFLAVAAYFGLVRCGQERGLVDPAGGIVEIASDSLSVCQYRAARSRHDNLFTTYVDHRPERGNGESQTNPPLPRRRRRNANPPSRCHRQARLLHPPHPQLPPCPA